MKTQCFLVLCFGVLATTAIAQEQKPAEKKPNDLRLFNTAVFGKPTTEPVVLLEPPSPEALDPETVMVDISKGHYFAATVRYPTAISFDDARKSLNKAYGKWEKEFFATDPDMGLWRNEDDQFSIQLSQDGFNVTAIYIKFTLLTEEKIGEGFSRAKQLMDDESNAQQTVTKMHLLLSKREFATFYETQCHQHFRDQVGEGDFLDFIRGPKGKEFIQLIGAVQSAIEDDKGRDFLISRHSERDTDEYEFVLVRERHTKGRRWHLELRKESGAWKLKDID